MADKDKQQPTGPRDLAERDAGFVKQGQPTPSGDATPTRKGAAMVKVTNKHTAPLGLPPVTHDRAKQRGIEIKGGEHLDRVLEPGENMIPAAHWELVKDESPVRNWIEEGMLYEGGDREAKPERTGSSWRESLTGLGEEEALQYVAASVDSDQLVMWAKGERRPPVRDAIQRRIEALSAGK